VASADRSAPSPTATHHPSPRVRTTLLQGAPEPIAALNRVRILEYARPWPEREPLVDIRLACPDVVLGGWLCPYLRPTVAEMVNRAQAALPPGYKLQLGTALRTLAMQQGGWDSYFRRMREEHPNWPLSALRRATNKYFAPYDQKAPPGHCTGGAVDVGLLNPAGEALDMTSPTKGWQGAYTWSDKLSPEARANRMQMVEVMLGAGFSNCRDEFWHYSWGDSAWAVRVGETECPYGWAHPPVRLEADFEGASAADLEMETTRDVNGRALHAEGFSTIPPQAEPTPDGLPYWRVGLFWAKGVPVALRLRWPLAEMPSLLVGNGKEDWQPVSEVAREGENLRLHLTPQSDRVFLTNHVPPATESEPQETDSSA
jgi:D-alanyl-D-alanine dipeptidase